MTKTAYCFPGQGPQDAALIRGALAHRSAMEDVFSHVRESGMADIDALDSMSDEGLNDLLSRNEMASLFTVLYALGCLADRDDTPDFLAGYSVGQFIALYVAGCYGAKTLIDIVWQRCLFMNAAHEARPGKMGAIIGLAQDKVQKLCEKHGVWISNFNARGQYTLAGDPDQVKVAVDESLTLGAHKSVMINTQGAWHCPMMDAATAPFAAYLEGIALASPRIPVINNVTGAFFPEDTAAIKRELVKHLNHAVQWEHGIRTMIESGASRLVEMGYGTMLTKFGFFISRDVTFEPCAADKKSKPCAA